MSKLLEKTDELKTVGIEKETWILEVTPEVCRKEGFPDGYQKNRTIAEQIELVLAVEADKLSVAEIEDWLRPRVKKVKGQNHLPQADG